MGLRYRKSLNFGPFRLNFIKSGIGYSIGGKHARYTKKANGGTRTTMTLPGTGISYVKDYSGNPATKKGTSSNPVPSTNPPRNKKPFPWRWVAFIFVVLMLIGSFPSTASIFLLIACVLLFPPLQKLGKTIYRNQSLASTLTTKGNSITFRNCKTQSRTRSLITQGARFAQNCQTPTAQGCPFLTNTLTLYVIFYQSLILWRMVLSYMLQKKDLLKTFLAKKSPRYKMINYVK